MSSEENKNEKKHPEQLSMDYGIAGEIINTPMPSPANAEGIKKDLDEGGLDISKYTGPDSRSSEQLREDRTFDQGRIHEESRVQNEIQAARNAAHRTGDTGGVSADRFGTSGSEDDEWENQAPGNDSV